MERRAKLRFDAHQPLQAKVLGDGEQRLDQEITGILENISGSGLRIISINPVPVGAAIQINLADSIILAEVRYLADHEPSPLQPDVPLFAIGLELKEILSRMNQLATLINGFSEQVKSTDKVPR